MTGEVVGDDSEWLVVEECLIAILQAATRDEEQAEARPRPLPKGGGQCEGAGEGVAPLRLPPVGGGNCYFYLMGLVGEWWLGRLRTMADEVAGFKRQGYCEPPLLECADELSFLQFRCIGRHEHWELHVHLFCREFLHGTGNPLCPLVG